MFEVRVQARFCATHQVRLYDGELEPLHGHDWRVEAVFRGPKLDEIGVLVDFVLVEQTLREIVARFHHGNLNDVPELADRSPTAECVARRVFALLQGELGPDVPLAGVAVEEAPGCVAAYWSDDARHVG